MASRRGSERLIAEGRVFVNGRTADDPGTIADPATDLILVDGRALPSPEPKRYVLLYKPAGYLTTLSDPRGRPAIPDLVPGERARLFPVGRLDIDAEGLLLLTNDGELAHRLLHPRYRIPRVYEVEVRGNVTEEGISRFREGAVLEDGPARPTEARLLRRDGETTWLRLTMTEGRFREVKRLCRALGHQVVRLRRIQFGPLRLGGLRPGQLRPLKPGEILALSKMARACAPGGNRL